MWHAARKQEKKLRGLMVDYKKRAERRRTYYEMIKKDPCSFLRLVGTSMKVNIDPAIAQAAESDRTMMAWNGDSNNMIDRFDVRSHLDFISEKTKDSLPDALELEDDMKCNYDRYRIIVQNDAAGIPEEAALRQIEVDEKYGDVTKHNETEKEKKKVLASKKAAIGFSYDDPLTDKQTSKAAADVSSEEESDEDFAELDLDIAFDIDEISLDLKQQLDIMATTFGMSVGEFSEQLRKDKQDQIDLKQARIDEEQKAALSGRKSRRERRIFKDNLLRLRGASPPRYRSDIAAPRESPTYNKGDVDTDTDSSISPEREGEFITTFGAPTKEKHKPVDFPFFIKLPNQTTDNSNLLQNKWKKQRLRSESPTFTKSRSKSPTRKAPESAKFNNCGSSSHSRIIKKYRRESSVSTNSSSDDSDSDGNKPVSSYRQRQVDRSDRKSYNSSAKAASYSGTQSHSSKLSAQERIKRKMKAALNKTYKDDKKKQAEKKEMRYQERRERDAEMRLIATELRRKDRVRRQSSSSSRSRSRSRSVSRGRPDSSSKYHRGSTSYGGYGSTSKNRSPENTSSSSKYQRSRSRSHSKERKHY